MVYGRTAIVSKDKSRSAMCFVNGNGLGLVPFALDEPNGTVKRMALDVSNVVFVNAKSKRQRSIARRDWCDVDDD